MEVILKSSLKIFLASLLVVFGLNLGHIRGTNASFVDTESSVKNSFTAAANWDDRTESLPDSLTPAAVEIVKNELATPDSVIIENLPDETLAPVTPELTDPALPTDNGDSSVTAPLTDPELITDTVKEESKPESDSKTTDDKPGDPAPAADDGTSASK